MSADPFVAFVVVAALADAAFILRLDIVSRYRRDVLDVVSRRADADIREGRMDWRRWYRVFDTVSYWSMLWRFWRRPATFFPPELRPVTRETPEP